MANEEIFIFSKGDITVLDQEVDLSDITSPLQDLDSMGTKVGELSSDSPVVITPERSTNLLKAFSKDRVVRVTATDASVTVAFSMLEDTDTTNSIYWTAGTEEAGVTTRKFNAAELKNMKIALDLISNDVDNQGTVRVQRFLLQGTMEAQDAISVAFGEPEIKTVTLRTLAENDGTDITIQTIDIPAGGTTPPPGDED